MKPGARLRLSVRPKVESLDPVIARTWYVYKASLEDMLRLAGVLKDNELLEDLMDPTAVAGLSINKLYQMCSRIRYVNRTGLHSNSSAPPASGFSCRKGALPPLAAE